MEKRHFFSWPSTKNHKNKFLFFFILIAVPFFQLQCQLLCILEKKLIQAIVFESHKHLDNNYSRSWQREKIMAARKDASASSFSNASFNSSNN